MRLAIIIVHYHTPDLLVSAINALQNDIDSSGLDAEIIVVDNGSTANDKVVFQQLPVQYINSGGNLGYARGINLGVANTSADILMFMNADVMVNEGCLEMLCKSLQGDVGVVAPRLYWDIEGTVILPPTEKFTCFDEVLRRLSGYSFFATWAQKRWRKHARYHWNTTQAITSYALSGAMLATRRDVWELLGGFDEQYMLYFEENDWLRRLEVQGFIAQYIPQASAHHIYNQSAVNEPKVQNWFAQSSEQFKRTYYGRFIWAVIKCIPTRHPKKLSFKVFSQGKPRIDLHSFNQARYPIWIEISPSVLGFPAGGVLIDNKAQLYWELDTKVWDTLMPATYYLQILDDRGHCLEQFSFAKHAE